MELDDIELKKVETGKLDPNPWNPNDMADDHFNMLKKEYQRVGYLQPVLVRPVEGDNGETRYQIIDGEHRWRALRQLEVDQLEVVVSDMSDSEARKTTLNMNDIKGSDNPVELAKVLDDLRNDESIEQLEEDLVMTSKEIKQHELLLDLPDEDDLADELDEAMEDEDEDATMVNIEFDVAEDQADHLQHEFSCDREDLSGEIKKFVLDQIL